MRRFARHTAVASAAFALGLALASCSSEPQSSPPAPTVTVTASDVPSPLTRTAATTTDDAAAPATATDSATTPALDALSTPVQSSAPLPAADFADGSQYSFATPSKQIQCRVTDGTFICQTQGHPHTVTTESLCGFYPDLEQSRAVRFGWFPSGPQPCATIIQGEGFDSEDAYRKCSGPLTETAHRVAVITVAVGGFR